MIFGLVFCFSCATHVAASTPVSYYTLSNPAFTAHSGAFHVYIEPRDIGDISVFSCSGKFNTWGFGLSNLRLGERSWYERRNWASIAHHFTDLPLSVGVNAGINKIYSETNVLTDIGVWLKWPLSSGLTFSNVFHRSRTLRGGVSYTWNILTATLEVEDSLSSNTYTPHGMIACTMPYRNFLFTASVGFYPDVFSGSIGIEYRHFISARFIYEDIEEDNVKTLIGIHFRPPVVVREIAVVETMTVRQPVIVEKTIVKKEPVPAPDTPAELTAEQHAYCEQHYMKGIEHYVNNQVDAAIREWNLVTDVDPDYKDVKRYLENARAKKELLDEH